MASRVKPANDHAPAQPRLNKAVCARLVGIYQRLAAAQVAWTEASALAIEGIGLDGTAQWNIDFATGAVVRAGPQPVPIAPPSPEPEVIQ